MDSFTLPAEFKAPEGKVEGDTVDVMATLKLLPNGQAQLVMIDGDNVGGEVEAEEEGEMETEAPTDKLYAQISTPQGGM